MNKKFMDMLVGYASAHQHPFNIAIHLVGIPTIMLGASVALSWASTDIAGIAVNLAYITVAAMFLFYLTLDRVFAVAFLLFAVPIAMLGTAIGELPMDRSAIIAAAAFFGGYLAQFIGHAVEKSVPVVLKHPVQANLAAPFFTVVEVFKILGLRQSLFSAMQREIALRRQQRSA